MNLLDALALVGGGVVLVLAGVGLGTVWRRATRVERQANAPVAPLVSTPPLMDGSDDEAVAAAQRPDASLATAADDATSAPEDLDALAAAIRPAYDAVGHPRELERYAEFRRAVHWFADARVSADEVVAQCTGANAPLAAAAAAALARRDDAAHAVDTVLDHLPHAYVWTTYHALRFIDAQARTPVVCRLLLATPEWWVQNPLMPRILSDFIDARTARGERLDLADVLGRRAPDSLGHFRAMLAKLSTPHAQMLEQQLEQWLASRVDRDYLGSVGRIVDGTRDGRAPSAHARLEASAAGIVAGVLGTPPRSFAVVGETGVGKSTVLRVVASRLTAQGWTVFEANAGDVLAGMVYIGELEGRIKRLVAELDVARRTVWLVANLAELAHAGRHRYTTTSALDHLLPVLESGRLVLLGEEEPDAFARMLQSRPRLRSLFRPVRIEPLSAADALDLGKEMACGEMASGRARRRRSVGRGRRGVDGARRRHVRRLGEEATHAARRLARRTRPSRVLHRRLRRAPHPRTRSRLHVLETADGGDEARRCTARVRVVPEPPAASRPREQALASALAALGEVGSTRTAIVRRYRDRPSPLVRDAAAGWRTGRLDLVLGGDFTVFR